jgi:hypothetical protein
MEGNAGMTWSLALIVSSVVSAGVEAAQAVTEANTGILIADQKQAAAEENARLSELKAVQDEIRRREDFAIWDNQLLANSYYDGPSFDAGRADAFDALFSDIENIRLQGRLESKSFLSQADTYEIEKDNLNTGKWLGVASASGTLFRGVYAAETHIPKKKGQGGVARAFGYKPSKAKGG